MKVRLTKIVSTHSRVRSEPLEGDCHKDATIGERFVVFGIEYEGKQRFIDTSPIVSRAPTENGAVHLTTHNSMYLLEYL